MVRLRTAYPFGNGHIQTLFPVFFRPEPVIDYQRSRFELSDGDFVDLDWSCANNKQLVLILHGLEGHSRRKYVCGMALAARACGFDVLAMNLRGCGGEPNRKLGMYHSGWTLDLHEVLLMLASKKQYQSVNLIGFSLGGNIILKYLGESMDLVPDCVGRSVVFSVPCDLEDAAQALSRPQCQIYTWYLLSQLRAKVIDKDRLFPGALDLSGLNKITTFHEFDNRFTAPVHGFRDALDYWRKSSSKQFLHKIKRPICLINAHDDPFLGPKCFPIQEAQNNSWLTLIVPPTGGHVGFLGTHGQYWSEWIAMRFLTPCQKKDVQDLSFFWNAHNFCA